MAESLTLRPPQFLFTGLEVLDGRGVLDSAPSAVSQYAVSQYFSRANGWQGIPSLCALRSFFSLIWISLELLDGRGVPDSASSAVLELLNGRVPMSLRPPQFLFTSLELLDGRVPDSATHWALNW